MLELAAHAFVATAGWADADMQALAGDASSRRYVRLRKTDGRSAVLMIAPPAPDDSTARFCAVAEHLAGLGLTAPALLARAADQGLLLLEDLGDAVFADVIAQDPGTETALYAAAVDCLLALHGHTPPPFLAALDANALAAMTAPAADWYLGHGTPRPDLADQLACAIAPALSGTLTMPLVLAHRDFHAENLIWLPDRAGPARVGLLDFQDAFAGPAVYDLVSLLEDARRDLAPGLRAAMIARYAAASGMPGPSLDRSLAVLGAQRNLRILGVFTRLSLQMDKPRYVDLIPRVWAHLMRDLAHPDLADLRALVATHLPQPTPEILQTLRSRCQMIPMP